MVWYIRVIRLILYILLVFFFLVIIGLLWNSNIWLVKKIMCWWLNKIIWIIGVEIYVLGIIFEYKVNFGIFYISNYIFWFDILVIGGFEFLNFLLKVEV